MKRITRTIGAGTRNGERVWLDRTGHWTRDESLAHEFEDDEAAKRIKRIPHSESVDPPSKQQEKNDV